MNRGPGGAPIQVQAPVHFHSPLATRPPARIQFRHAAMLSIKQYPKDYIQACREKMDTQLASYRKLIKTADARSVATFAPHFFNHLVLVLETNFVHRARALEGSDGNPLNEVRMLAASLQRHEGVLTVDKTITYEPDESVLKLRIGEKIELDEPSFVVLSRAFFREIEEKFGHAPDGQKPDGTP
jgi:hypothetical protein